MTKIDMKQTYKDRLKQIDKDLKKALFTGDRKNITVLSKEKKKIESILKNI